MCVGYVRFTQHARVHPIIISSTMNLNTRRERETRARRRAHDMSTHAAKLKTHTDTHMHTIDTNDQIDRHAPREHSHHHVHHSHSRMCPFTYDTIIYKHITETHVNFCLRALRACALCYALCSSTPRKPHAYNKHSHTCTLHHSAVYNWVIDDNRDSNTRRRVEVFARALSVSSRSIYVDYTLVSFPVCR